MDLIEKIRLHFGFAPFYPLNFFGQTENNSTGSKEKNYMTSSFITRVYNTESKVCTNFNFSKKELRREKMLYNNNNLIKKIRR